MDAAQFSHNQGRSMKHCRSARQYQHARRLPHARPSLNEIRDLKPGMVVHTVDRIVRKLGQAAWAPSISPRTPSWTVAP